MITLKQLIPALVSVGASAEKVELAIAELKMLQDELENIEVKGRQNVDTLLGCMMAIDAIIGKDEANGEQTNI